MKLFGETMSRLVLAAVCAAVSMGLSGCLHKKAQSMALPPPQAPVALAPPPTSDHLPMLEVPPVVTPPVPTAAAASKPRRERRRSATKPSPVSPPQLAVVEGLPETSAIGALTAGGDSSPQLRQEAADLIAANDKRLKGLPAKTVADMRTEISKIVNFQRQAQEALDSGDAEGAKTLATKVHLLLVDIDPNSGN